MERFNPFSSDLDPDPFTTSFNRSSETQNKTASQETPDCNNNNKSEPRATDTIEEPGPSVCQPTLRTADARYTTSFPDPFADLPIETATPSVATPAADESRRPILQSGATRPDGVTFGPMSAHSVDDLPDTRRPAGARQRSELGGFSSFLSRATSVTSSSVTDRVSGAVGSVRSAVDSISSQIQQAVPSNLNDRLTSTATNLIGGDQSSGQSQQQQQQQPSAASYLASKLSSATGQFASATQSPTSLALISRQRVIVILDSLADTDWALQFTNYRRLIAGLGPLSSASQSALSSFFSQATAQLSSSSSSLSAGANLDADLIEQVDFRNVSILANQSTSTATIFVANNQNQSQPQQQQQHLAQNQQLIRTNSQTITRSQQQQQQTYRIIRPEYVVVRQRSKDRQDDLRLIVNALNYCLVPLFEPIEIWNCFQDRQLLFSKLLLIQRQLGKENFPLIPQVYCQTHRDLLNYINGPSVYLPCLVRIGSTGQGKIRIDNQQMFRDFSTIMATSGLSCTVEPHLDVKCDLIVQKLGTNLKSFRRLVRRQQNPKHQSYPHSPTMDGGEPRRGFLSDGSFSGPHPDSSGGQPMKQGAFRQTSLGSGVLSGFMAASSSSQQQSLSRRSSNPASQNFEKVTEVNVRYKTWLEAVERQFDHKLEAFCMKIVVASNDREYIVGMRDCSLDFLGTLDNQEEDKRSFVELIISHMNTNLPKHSGGISRETSLNMANQPVAQVAGSQESIGSDPLKRSSIGDDKATTPRCNSNQQDPNSNQTDRKKFTSQTQINGQPSRSSSGLGSRSQSVSVNQSDYLKGEQSINRPYFTRRGSDRSEASLTDSELAGSTVGGGGGDGNDTSTASGLNQRQSSLGLSFLDQTSTALSSFQKQSMSFFKRFDSQATGSNTPPQSAKSDRSFLISSTSTGSQSPTGGTSGFATRGATGSLPRAGNGFKSQSMDTHDLDHNYGKLARKAPPKPPPPSAPQSLVNRQSSLASYSSGSIRKPLHSSTATPNSTPVQTRQNSTVSEGSQQKQQQQRTRVVRQNSALSAFEPFDPELATAASIDAAPGATSAPGPQVDCSEARPAVLLDKPRRPSETAAKRTGNFDSASITSGDSNSTGETTTGEDTMNNLKKTFASIFGDKCD